MPRAFINLYNKRKFHKRNVCKNNYLLIHVNVLFLNTAKKNYLFWVEKTPQNCFHYEFSELITASGKFID